MLNPKSYDGARVLEASGHPILGLLFCYVNSYFLVGPEKEEEEDKLERFFCHLYEFHNPVRNAPGFVPTELPHRYAINFVPAVSASSVVPAIAVTAFVPNPVVASSDYSVVSSATFVIAPSSVLASPVIVSSSAPTCIENP